MDIITLLPIILSAAVLILIIITLLKVNKPESSFKLEDMEKLFDATIEKIERTLRDEFSRNREESASVAKLQREEMRASLDKFSEQLSKLTDKNEERFDKLTDKVGIQLKDIQENNSKKLEEMRVTVDEKLHSTLEKRLGESFNIVSTQLKSVYEGLGEMQKLATGVGDLKRVLTNVKARGTWGEVQLERLIEQILTPEQYAKNVKTKKSSNAIVEFAIKMPGSQDDEPVWIPVDAKFPLEDYQKLMDAQEVADITLITEISKAIDRRIKLQAKDIHEKYIDPPNTTDFALMFLPVEGLYAEVLRIPGLCDFVQREHRVTITGPTTFLAVLNSLQMGFRTLAIQKKSSEVWKILGGVKTEFGKFGDVLDKTQKKLLEASNTIDDASKRSRAIERKLRDVHELPAGDDDLKLLDD